MNLEHFEKQGNILVPSNKIVCRGLYEGTIIRDGKVIDEFEHENLVTNEGLNAMLGVMLYGATQLTSWYLGLFEGNYTPVGTDTAATLPANSTEDSAFVASTRAQWIPAAPSGQSITNSASRASYTFNATKTIYGAFLVSSATINGTTGTSFSAARFSVPKSVVANDQLLLTYTFTAASN